MNLLSKLFLLTFLISCSQESYQRSQEDIILSAGEDKNTSSTAGNFVASAMRKVHELDIVLYPKMLINPNEVALLPKDSSKSDLEQILKLYPQGTLDQFYVGTMSGKNLKKLLFNRILEVFSAELEVAGLNYFYHFDGGYPLNQSVTLENNQRLKEKKLYRVALSKHFFFSGDTFPSYKFRNSIERIFHNHFVEISARDSITELLHNTKYSIPFLNKNRAVVKHVKSIFIGKKLISEVQGVSHLSPYKGDEVVVEGIITAAASVDWYPGGAEYYIQEEDSDKDNDPRTSEGVHLYIDDQIVDFKVGDKVELRAQIYEQYTSSGLTRTQLRNIKSYQILSRENSLPKVIDLGETGVKIPKKHISTYYGNLNNKKELKLTDGIDFWESFEGMRVSITNPKVMGFRGGKESSDPFDIKKHLTLYTLPDGTADKGNIITEVGGVMPDPDHHLWNPSLITIASGNLTKNLNPNRSYNVGEVITGRLEGIVRYTKNLFGDGEYNFIIPTEQTSLLRFNQRASAQYKPACLDSQTGVVELVCRPKVSFKSTDDKLTIAAYNLKNLSGNDENRIESTGQMIASNLKCPDILGLVEVQDDNGLDYTGSSDATGVLNKLIELTPCAGKKYKALNINPQLHTDGGQPGGNIRVAMLYDANKLEFDERLIDNPLDETVVLKGGILSNNPGRVFPNDPVFRRTRKSLVAQFKFKGNDVYVIVNHFNSKLGDKGHWGAEQPVTKGSEVKRGKLAYKVNEFVNLIERRNPNAHIAVLGDFNAYLNEAPMRILEGNSLYNLMRDIPEHLRYTTNHNGNSQSLDYIFVNKNLRAKNPEFNVLHLNSNYMGRLSDHDPISSAFEF